MRWKHRINTSLHNRVPLQLRQGELWLAVCWSFLSALELSSLRAVFSKKLGRVEFTFVLEKDFPESCLVYLLPLVEAVFSTTGFSIMGFDQRFSISWLCGGWARRIFTTFTTVVWHHEAFPQPYSYSDWNRAELSSCCRRSDCWL